MAFLTNSAMATILHLVQIVLLFLGGVGAASTFAGFTWGNDLMLFGSAAACFAALYAAMVAGERRVLLKKKMEFDGQLRKSMAIEEESGREMATSLFLVKGKGFVARKSRTGQLDRGHNLPYDAEVIGRKEPAVATRPVRAAKRPRRTTVRKCTAPTLEQRVRQSAEDRRRSRQGRRAAHAAATLANVLKRKAAMEAAEEAARVRREQKKDSGVGRKLRFRKLDVHGKTMREMVIPRAIIKAMDDGIDVLGILTGGSSSRGSAHREQLYRLVPAVRSRDRFEPFFNVQLCELASFERVRLREACEWLIHSVEKPAQESAATGKVPVVGNMNTYGGEGPASTTHAGAQEERLDNCLARAIQTLGIRVSNVNKHTLDEYVPIGSQERKVVESCASKVYVYIDDAEPARNHIEINEFAGATQMTWAEFSTSPLASTEFFVTSNTNGSGSGGVFIAFAILWLTALLVCAWLIIDPIRDDFKIAGRAVANSLADVALRDVVEVATHKIEEIRLGNIGRKLEEIQLVSSTAACAIAARLKLDVGTDDSCAEKLFEVAHQLARIDGERAEVKLAEFTRVLNAYYMAKVPHNLGQTILRALEDFVKLMAALALGASEGMARAAGKINQNWGNITNWRKVVMCKVFRESCPHLTVPGSEPAQPMPPTPIPTPNPFEPRDGYTHRQLVVAGLVGFASAIGAAAVVYLIISVVRFRRNIINSVRKGVALTRHGVALSIAAAMRLRMSDYITLESVIADEDAHELTLIGSPRSSTSDDRDSEVRTPARPSTTQLHPTGRSGRGHDDAGRFILSPLNTTMDNMNAWEEIQLRTPHSPVSVSEARSIRFGWFIVTTTLKMMYLKHKERVSRGYQNLRERLADGAQSFEEIFKGTPMAAPALTPQAAAYARQQRRLAKLPYAVPYKTQHLLEELALEHNAFGAAHSHPVNWYLQQETRKDCGRAHAGRPTTVIALKEADEYQYGEDFELHGAVQNLAHTAHDWIRYDSFKDDTIRIETANAHIDGCLQHLQFSDVTELFARNQELQVLTANGVIPYEAKFGTDSWYPDLYQYQTVDDEIVYIPEGHAGGSYSQPADAYKWIETSHLIAGKVTLTVSRLYHKGAHVAFVIVRGSNPTEAVRAVATGDYVKLHPLWAAIWQFSNPFIHKSTQVAFALFGHRYSEDSKDDYNTKAAQLATIDLGKRTLGDLLGAATAGYTIASIKNGWNGYNVIEWVRRIFWAFPWYMVLKAPANRHTMAGVKSIAVETYPRVVNVETSEFLDRTFEPHALLRLPRDFGVRNVCSYLLSKLSIFVGGKILAGNFFYLVSHVIGPVVRFVLRRSGFAPLTYILIGLYMWFTTALENHQIIRAAPTWSLVERYFWFRTYYAPLRNAIDGLFGLGGRTARAHGLSWPAIIAILAYYVHVLLPREKAFKWTALALAITWGIYVVTVIGFNLLAATVDWMSHAITGNFAMANTMFNLTIETPREAGTRTWNYFAGILNNLTYMFNAQPITIYAPEARNRRTTRLANELTARREEEADRRIEQNAEQQREFEAELERFIADDEQAPMVDVIDAGENPIDAMSNPIRVNRLSYVNAEPGESSHPLAPWYVDISNMTVSEMTTLGDELIASGAQLPPARAELNCFYKAIQEQTGLPASYAISFVLASYKGIELRDGMLAGLTNNGIRTRAAEIFGWGLNTRDFTQDETHVIAQNVVSPRAGRPVLYVARITTADGSLFNHIVTDYDSITGEAKLEYSAEERREVTRRLMERNRAENDRLARARAEEQEARNRANEIRRRARDLADQVARDQRLRGERQADDNARFDRATIQTLQRDKRLRDERNQDQQQREARQNQMTDWRRALDNTTRLAQNRLLAQEAHTRSQARDVAMREFQLRTSAARDRTNREHNLADRLAAEERRQLQRAEEMAAQRNDRYNDQLDLMWERHQAQIEWDREQTHAHCNHVDEWCVAHPNRLYLAGRVVRNQNQGLDARNLEHDVRNVGPAPRDPEEGRDERNVRRQMRRDRRIARAQRDLAEAEANELRQRNAELAARLEEQQGRNTQEAEAQVENAPEDDALSSESESSESEQEESENASQDGDVSSSEGDLEMDSSDYTEEDLTDGARGSDITQESVLSSNSTASGANESELVDGADESSASRNMMLNGPTISVGTAKANRLKLSRVHYANYRAYHSLNATKRIRGDVYNAKARLSEVLARNYMLPRVELRPTSVIFTANKNRATLLAHDLRENSQLWLGATLDKSYAVGIPYSVKVDDEVKTVKTMVFHGVPGCGKTTAVVNALRNYRDLERVAWWSPNALASAKAQDDGVLGPHNSRGYLCDFEILRKTDFEVLVIDDYGKLLPGMLDLLPYIWPNLEQLILTGDPCQGSRMFPTETAESRGLCSDIALMVAEHPQISYGTISYRHGKRMSQWFGWHSGLTTRQNTVAMATANHYTDVPLLAASSRFVSSLSAGAVNAITMSESQGVTFEGDYSIDMSGLTNKMSDAIAMVALTRGKSNLHIVFNANDQVRRNTNWGTSSIFNALIADLAKYQMTPKRSQLKGSYLRRAMIAHIFKCNPSLLNETLRKRHEQVGPLMEPLDDGHLPLGDFEQTYQDTKIDEQLRKELGMYMPVSRYYPSALDSKDDGEPEELITGSDGLVDPIFSRHMDLGISREEGEVFVGDAVTHQVGRAADPNVLTHSASDRATARLSEKKRLRFAMKKDNVLEFEKGKTRGLELFESFLSLLKSKKSGLNARLYEECVDQAMTSWLDSRTVKEAILAIRSDPIDLPDNQARLILKSQLLKKIEKYGSKAVAGQTVTDMALSRTINHAAAALYIEKIMMQLLPENIYVHLRRSNKAFSKWVMKHRGGRRIKTFFTNDYTAWDSSVDGACLQFDVALLRHFGLPESFVDYFTEHRVHTTTVVGTLGLMQFSGDRWTFLLNTVRNVAYTNYKSIIPRGTPMAFAGDDSLILNYTPKANPRWKRDDWKFTSKEEISTEKGEFIGMTINNGGEVGMNSAKLRTAVTLALGELRNDSPHNKEVRMGYARFEEKLVAILDLLANAPKLPSVGEGDALLAQLANAIHKSKYRFSKLKFYELTGKYHTQYMSDNVREIQPNKLDRIPRKLAHTL